jgi:hypothetical protein
MPLLVVELGLTHECITEPSFITPCVAEWPSASAPPLLVRPPMEAAVLGSVDHMARAAGCTPADYSCCTVAGELRWSFEGFSPPFSPSDNTAPVVSPPMTVCRGRLALLALLARRRFIRLVLALG